MKHKPHLSVFPVLGQHPIPLLDAEMLGHGSLAEKAEDT